MNYNSKLWHWLILLLLAFIWGSSFILMKRGLEVFSSTEVASLRIFIAFLFLIPFAMPHFKIMGSNKGPYIFLVGLMGNGIPAFLFTKAQMGLSSSLTGMLNSLVPLFTLLIGVVVFKTKIKFHNALGILIGLAGAVGLIAANNNTFSGSFEYALYVIIATILYASTINIIKKYLSEVSSVQIASLAFMFIGPFAGIYLFLATDFVKVAAINPGAMQSIAYISILAVIGSALSVMIFNVLIKITSAIFASSVTYIIPVFAMLWGVFDGEAINLIHLASIAVILTGVYLVNKKNINFLLFKTKKEALNLGE
jgi:drug/metabolite transporter (DMT)-like permease